MNKKLAVFTSAIILAGVAVPYGIGMVFHSRVESIVEYFNKKNPTVQFKIIEYKTGWLSSEFKYTFSTLEYTESKKMTTEKDELKPIPGQQWTPWFNATAEVSHGPFVYDYESQSWTMAYISGRIVDYQVAQKDAMKAAVLDFLKFKNNFLWTFTGKFTSDFSIQPFSRNYFETMSMDFGGFVCHQEFPFGFLKFNIEDVKTLGVSCNLKPVKVTNKAEGSQFEYVMQPVNFTWDLDRSNDYALWMGVFKLKGEGLQFTSSQLPSPVKLGVYTMDGDSVIQDKNLNGGEGLSFNNLVTYSDLVPQINNADLKLRFSNLNPAGFVFLQEFVEKAEKQNPAANPFADETKSEAFVKEFLSKILYNTTRADLTVSVKLPAAEATINAGASWPTFNDKMMPAEVGKSTKMNAKIMLPADLTDAIADRYFNDASLPQTGEKPASAVTPSSPVEKKPDALKAPGDFPELVAADLKSGELNYTTSMELLEMYGQRKDMTVFETIIKKNEVKAETADALRGSYQQWISGVSAASNGNTVQTPAAPTPVVPEKKMTLKEQIQDWVRNGYILKNEQNQYVIVLEGTLKDGFIMVNGKKVDLPK